MSRMTDVRNLLISNQGRYFSVREVCRELGIADSIVKPVFSSFNSMRHSGEVSVKRGKCSVTHKTVKLYTWVGKPAAAAAQAPSPPPPPPTPPPRTARPKKARAGAQPRTTPFHQPQQPTPPPQQPKAPPPPQPPKPTAAELRRAEARRRLVESTRAERERLAAEATAKDTLERARITFQALTGILPASGLLGEMKKAYRQAAMRLHPDRGGDAAKFAELSVAWTEVERAFA